MEVILAEYLGFCYGVKRAIRLARDSAESGNASTLGPIIHNPQMVARLEEEGVGSVDSVDEVPDGGRLSSDPTASGLRCMKRRRNDRFGL